MSRQIRYILFILVLLTTSLGALPSPAVQANPEAPAGGMASASLDCALLLDPKARALLSKETEWALLRACVRPRLDFAPAGGLLQTSAEEVNPATLPPVGPDVRANAVDPPVGSTIQSETSIAVNENTGALCVTYNDLYHSGQGDGYTGYTRSTDGGQTWQDGGPFPPGGGGVSRGDPSVAWRRADGYFYYTSLVVVGSEFGVGLWRSLDDCATFEWVSMAHDPYDDDKEFMIIDNNPASPYYGRLYIVWSDLSAYIVRLVYSDDGITWQGPVNLFSGVSFGAWPAVAPNGDVYVTWMTWNPYPSYFDVQVTRSTDGGSSFTLVAEPLTSAIAPQDAQATTECGRPALNGYIRYFPLPQISVGPDGCLHVVNSYDPDGFYVGDASNAYYRRSCDNGASWEPEIQLNDDGGLTDQFFPALTVTQDNIVVASWYDRRLDPGGNWYVDRYWTVSYDGGTTWEPNERVSDVSSPVYSSPGLTGCYHGDYDQMATLGDTVYHVWSDDRIFFNGHYDPDIWFDQATIVPDFGLEVAPDGHKVCRPAVVTSTVTLDAIRGYSQSVTLSDSGVPAGVETGFTVNPVALPGTSTYVITVTAGAAMETYNWLVTGASSTLTHDVTVTLVVSSPITALDFTWVPVTPTVGEVVTLTASATGTWPISFTWNFGDGSGGQGLAVTHIYTTAGEHLVTLTAANGCGMEVVTDVVTILSPPCEPVQIVTVTTAISDCAVSFGAELTGTSPFSWLWDFSALGTSADPTPTVDFDNSGTYPYTLTVLNCDGVYSDSHVDQVTVACCQPVTATAFSWTPLTPTAGQVVTLTATVWGQRWTSETVETGMGARFPYLALDSAGLPHIAYNGEASYDIQMAYFDYSSGPGVDLLYARLEILTPTPPISYTWDLGDGTLAQGEVVQNSYTQPGIYTVVLTATNCNGVAAVTASHVLTVLPACEPVEILEVSEAISGCQVAFSTTLTGTAPYTYSWDFGPFGGSAALTPTVDFGSDGSYPYTLGVTNACGADVLTGTVVVTCTPPCEPVRILAVPSQTAGCVVTFTAELTGTPQIRWLWDFGFTQTATLQPVIDFDQSGHYTGTLQAWNCGDEGYDAYPFVLDVACAVEYRIYLPLLFKAR